MMYQCFFAASVATATAEEIIKMARGNCSLAGETEGERCSRIYYFEKNVDALNDGLIKKLDAALERN